MALDDLIGFFFEYIFYFFFVIQIKLVRPRLRRKHRGSNLLMNFAHDFSPIQHVPSQCVRKFLGKGGCPAPNTPGNRNVSNALKIYRIIHSFPPSSLPQPTDSRIRTHCHTTQSLLLNSLPLPALKTNQRLPSKSFLLYQRTQWDPPSLLIFLYTDRFGKQRRKTRLFLLWSYRV